MSLKSRRRLKPRIGIDHGAYIATVDEVMKADDSAPLPELTIGEQISDLYEEAAEREAIQQESPEETERRHRRSVELGLGITRMDDVKPETVQWFWKPRIPRGKITSIEGDPGLGKSFITLALATAESLGRGLPGEEPREPGRIVIASVEDGLADTVRPRLDMMGADCSRITAITKPLTLNVDGFAELDNIFSLLKPTLSILDPLFAFTGGKMDIHRSNEVGEFMDRLARLAESYCCAILGVRHLTKGNQDKAIYRGIGSIGLTGRCRSVLLVGADANDRNRRAIVQTKNNLAPLADPIGYSLTEGQFAWTGVSDVTAEQILGNEQDAADALPIDEAVEFLTTMLDGGPVSQKDVKSAAKSAGIAEKTLYRAKTKMKVKSQKAEFGGPWVWTL